MKRLLSFCLIVFIALNVAACGNRREKYSSPNEEVYFNVEWVDEDTIKLIYNDESHQGKYYEEFEIDL